MIPIVDIHDSLKSLSDSEEDEDDKPDDKNMFGRSK